MADDGTPRADILETGGAAPRPTPRCQRVLASAAEIAAHNGHAHLGVEHLFLAILADADAVPTQVLAQICDPDEAAERLRAVLRSPSYTDPPRPPAGAACFPPAELGERLRAAIDESPLDATVGFNLADSQAWITVT